MKKKKDIEFFKQNNNSLYYTLTICLLVFLSAISVLIFAFNRLITDHDKSLSKEMCILLSEKANNSIDSMTASTSNVADIISARSIDSPQEIYQELKEYGGLDYLSIGFIDEEGNFYGSSSEREEFEKWDLFEVARSAEPVAISIPYRSTAYGQHVITIFSGFEYGRSKKGYIFTTYLFKDLRDAVATKSLENDIQIVLINAESANIIRCVDNKELADGSWTNAYLAFGNLDDENKTKVFDWLNRMFNGENNVSVNYTMDDVTYTQCGAVIPSMPGWYVSVRIPGNAMSKTMHIFRNYVLIFTSVLLLVVIILIFNMYRLSKRQTKLLENLSIYDPLTGVFNRRAFDYAASTIISHGKKCALIFFDIDYFKQANDKYGHDAGDRVLKTFAGILKENFSGEGIVSRFGGDEFVVLVDMPSKESINEKLEKAAKQMREADIIDFPGTDDKAIINFSAGAAACPKDAQDLSNLKKCADTALYSVKEHGRNGYDWYDPERV